MKPTISINVNLSTRKALYWPSNYNICKYKLSAQDPTPVDVFGLFAVKESDGDSDAYFVVKLPDGHCCYASVDQIQFLPEEDVE
jgi:hypothetical protein